MRLKMRATSRFFRPELPTRTRGTPTDPTYEIHPPATWARVDTGCVIYSAQRFPTTNSFDASRRVTTKELVSRKSWPAGAAKGIPGLAEETALALFVGRGLVRRGL